MQHRDMCFGLTGSLLALLFGLALPAVARPLDADACARLKLQRDALEQAGARSAVNQPPPALVQHVLDPSAQQVRTLIDLDGQLRFRCAIDLPILTLRPDLLVETPDTVEGEPPPVAPRAKASRQKAMAARRAKVATDKAEHAPAANDTAATLGTPVPQTRKTAAAKAKTRVRADDAYHRPAIAGSSVAPATPSASPE